MHADEQARLATGAGHPETEPEITVIVVNYNGGEYIRRCIASLAAQTFRDFETIIVDNASTDGSIAGIAERPAQTLIMAESVNHGFAAGNNLAARRARGRWLALLNPDAEAEPDWLESLVRAVQMRPTYRLVASLQIAAHDDRLLDGAGDCYLAWGYAWRGGHGHSRRETPPAGECFAPCGAAAFYPKDAFLASGGFDERYFCYHEDVDLGFRLRLMGERCQFDPACRVRHVGSGITGKASRFAVFHGARNSVWTYVKNMPSRLLLVTAPVWIAAALALLVRSVLKGRGVATFQGLAAGLGGLETALTERRRVRRMRRVSAGAIMAAFSWNPLLFLGRRCHVRPFLPRDPRGAPDVPSPSNAASF
jgi:GT2 family glycosyltransferase